MPAKRSPTPMRGRRTAIAAGLAAFVATAACGTAASDAQPTGSSTTTSTLLAPWQGTLTTTSLPAPVQNLRQVTCVSAARCWAVGSTSGTTAAGSGPVIVSTRDGGVRWTVQTLPAGVGYLSDIACATSRACAAVGQMGGTGVGPGAVLTTTDGGGTWAPQAVPAGTTDVTAVACRPDGGCMALGTVGGRVTALTYAGGGGTWTPGGALPPTASSATSVTCTDDQDCWATTVDTVDAAHSVGGIAATADGGATWTPETPPVGTGQLNAVTCSTPPATGTSTNLAPACTAVGTTSTVTEGTRVGQAVVLTSTDGGATWTAAPAPATAADLLDLSCGAGPCVAVGETVATATQAGVVVLTPATGASVATWRRAVDGAGRPTALRGLLRVTRRVRRRGRVGQRAAHLLLTGQGPVEPDGSAPAIRRAPGRRR